MQVSSSCEYSELFGNIWKYLAISGNTWQDMEINDIDSLLPKRKEIYLTIKDHGLMNFDMIRRRFMAVNERTLRYDLKKLADAKLIKKLGTTKGVYYETIS